MENTRTQPCWNDNHTTVVHRSDGANCRAFFCGLVWLFLVTPFKQSRAQSADTGSQRNQLQKSIDSTADTSLLPLDIAGWELLGNAEWFSFDYERYLGNHFGVRIGWGAMPIKDTETINKPDISASPVWMVLAKYFSPLFRSTHWYWDFGAGILSLSYPGKSGLWPFTGNAKVGTSNIGIRYWPSGWGFTYGLTIVQFYNPRPIEVGWFFGLSVGVAF
jgi:hypothetical protein